MANENTRRLMRPVYNAQRGDCYWCHAPLVIAHEVRMRDRVFQKDGYLLYKMANGAWKRKRYATVDHVRPRAAGGANTADNVVVACAPCNSSRTPDAGWPGARKKYDNAAYVFPPSVVKKNPKFADLTRVTLADAIVRQGRKRRAAMVNRGGRKRKQNGRRRGQTRQPHTLVA